VTVEQKKFDHQTRHVPSEVVEKRVEKRKFKFFERVKASQIFLAVEHWVNIQFKSVLPYNFGNF
jgi:hypothetical protein